MSGATEFERDLAARFERLLALDGAGRAAALADPALDEAVRGRLLRLLAADVATTDAVRDIVAGAAGRAAAELPGTRTVLGPWRLLREIGSGGMGTVFLAERADGSYQARVAVKLLRGFPTADGHQRLRAERQILVDLDHPNIARLIDGGETGDGQPYLVLEYVEGVPLTTYIDAVDAPRAQRLVLVRQVLDAVAHAHGRLVIHRDLKPSNILVRDDGVPKLLDFGIARLMESAVAPDVAAPTTRTYTPGFASPEQRLGAAVTVASDVFSLGRVLSAVLGWPAGGDVAGDPAIGVAQRAIPRDRELKAIVARATDPDPAARYASVEALRDDLDRLQQSLPVLAVRQTRAYRLRKFCRRYRLGVALALAFACVVGAFVIRLQSERAAAVEARIEADAARDTAEAANESASRVSRFLGQVFVGVGPIGRDGAEPTVSQFIERAEQRVERDFVGTVAERHEVLLLVANAWINARRPDRALPVLQRLIDGGAFAADPVRRADLFRSLAVTLNDQPDRRAAAVAVERGRAALDGAGQLPGAADVLGRLHVQAFFSRLDTSVEEQQQVARRGADFARASLPVASPIRLQLLANLARSLEAGGDYRATLDAREEVAAALAQTDRVWDSDRFWHALNLARALRLNERLEEAGATLDDAVRVHVRAFGEAGGSAAIALAIERTDLAAWRGDAVASRNQLAEVVRLSRTSRASVPLPRTWALLRMQIALLEGDPATARRLREDARSASTDAFQQRQVERIFERFASAGR
jgi:hypothetical protein